MTEIKVKRIKQGCCGMVEGETYDAVWDSIGFYVLVDVDGEYSSPHWFPGCFELVDDCESQVTGGEDAD